MSYRFAPAWLGLALVTVAHGPISPSLSTDLVISQVFSGGGNSNAPFRHDFIELFNRGVAPIDLAGWSVHYTSAASATWQKTELAGSLAPGQYFLIQQASGGASGSSLPAPDLTGSIAMSSSAGKIALLGPGAVIPTGTACPGGAGVVDFVGYGGSANCYEGQAPAPAPGNTRSLRRAGEGCAESDSNAADFATGPPSPRTSASPPTACGGSGTAPTGAATPAGSVLIFPVYDSDALDPRREDTRLSLTNTHATKSVVAHLYFVAGDSGAVADAFVCLTPSQTLSFLASDSDPGVAGYVAAGAVDGGTGCPVDFNYLIGEAAIRLASGHAAELPAVAFPALAAQPARCPAGSATAEIGFDGESYGAAPRALAVSSFPSPAGRGPTLLILDRLQGSLVTGPSTIGPVMGLVFDDRETAFSFEFSSARRQLRAALSEEFPRTAPRLTAVVPSGRTGWIKLWRVSDGALLGAVLDFGQPPETSGGGRLLHALTLTTAASFVVPIFPPNC